MRVCLSLALLLLLCVPLAEAQPERRKGGSVPEGGVLKSGPLPDLNAFDLEGKPIKLRKLCEGKYTVLVAGCLTCPKFHQSYRAIEAASADYAPKDVQFFYFYKSLRHPELGGYVEPQNMDERLLHVAEAKKKLGTKVPWIADTLDDSLRIGLQSGSLSVYLISPKGEVVFGTDEIDEAGLRKALAKAAGPVDQPTSASDLDLPRVERAPRPINKESETGVERPTTMTILSITPTNPDETYYVKLRAEADQDLIRTGSGRLFLGFYPDPIHDAKWNNLTPAMKYELATAEGVTATPAEATAAVGKGDSDTQPRQFWVDIKSEGKPGEAKLTLHYFGCTPAFCKAMTHTYTIEFKAENRAARTYGFKGRGNNRQRGDRPKR
ncbi:MAG: TlpA family protein disulfide reductase [Phycisphaeraceae bacterium]